MNDFKVLDIGRVEDDISEFEGHLEVDGVVAKFLADQDGTIYGVDKGNGLVGSLLVGGYAPKIQEKISEAIISAIKEYNAQNKDKFFFRYKDCHYDEASEVLQTQCNMTLDGKQYSVVVSDSRLAVNNTTIKDDNGLSIYADEFGVVKGEGIGTAEGEKLMAMIKKITAAAERKAKEYQCEYLGAICAKLSKDFSHAGREDINTEVEHQDVKENGAVEVTGYVVLMHDGEETTLGFTADGNGKIESLCLAGVDLLDKAEFPDNPLSSGLMNALGASIADAIAEMNREAEKTMDVRISECEYDKDNNVMISKGELTKDGKQYAVEFVENGGVPSINVVGDDVEVGGRRGGSIEGYALNSPEGRDLTANLDAIFNAVADKADAYQRTEPDGRLARLNYIASEITGDDIEVVTVDKNTGDIGGLVGKVKVEDETLRFTADRDGSVTQLALHGEPLADPRAMNLSDDLVDLVYDAIEKSVDEYVRDEQIAKAFEKGEPDKGKDAQLFER